MSRPQAVHVYLLSSAGEPQWSRAIEEAGLGVSMPRSAHLALLQEPHAEVQAIKGETL